MRVYRYLTEEELNDILQGHTDNIGGNYYGMDNTFAYKKDKKYVHFFKKLSDIKYIRALKKWRIEQGHFPATDFYICAFDVPAIILMLSSGEGVYYRSDEHLNGIKVKEYALKNRLIKQNWLKSYVRDDLNAEFDSTRIKNDLSEIEERKNNHFRTI